MRVEESNRAEASTPTRHQQGLLYCLTPLIPKEDPVEGLFLSSSAQTAISVRSQVPSLLLHKLGSKMVVHIRAKANSYNFAIVFFIGLGSFAYGFNSTIIGPIIGLPSFGAYNGVYAGGGAIGCWIVNWLSYNLGRKLAIQIIAVIYITSAALPAGSDLVADGEVGTAHQAGQVDVDRLVARRFRVSPEVGSLLGLSVRTFDRLFRHLEITMELPVRRCRRRCTSSRLS